MKTITEIPNRFRLYAAGLALSALAITLLAVAIAGGSVQAQSVTPTPTPVVNTYPDPQPCGEGAATAFQPEPHEIKSGHFALFDSYWRATGASTGVLHTNLCPPLVVKKTETQNFETVTVTTRSSSGIDIDEAIMHVLDKHKVDVVATNAEATDGQLSLEEYPEVRKALGIGATDAVPEGTQVWWLRLDDPDTAKDETSDLSLGFSTALFDSDHWLTSADTDEDGNAQPMHYKFEVERFPGSNPADVPHFLAYEAPKSDNAEQRAVWNSIRPDIDDDDMTLDPGEYRALQWVFTKSGTYLLSVHLQGFVRKDNPHAKDDIEYDMNWEPISGNETATGEVKQYTIQVGSDLSEMEPPLFGVNLSVSENSPGGVRVGGPIPVYESEADALTYSLGGDGHASFKAVEATDPRGSAPHAVQIVVADNANLDYETKSSYNLTLSVTDGVDHENNKDDMVDDTLAVRIDLEDQAPGLELYPDPYTEFVPVGETVKLIALYEPTPAQRDEMFIYQWAELISVDGELKWRAISVEEAPSAPTWSVSKATQAVRTYQVSVVFSMSEVMPPPRVSSNRVQVRWTND